jgi:hypothetical protein
VNPSPQFRDLLSGLSAGQVAACKEVRHIPGTTRQMTPDVQVRKKGRNKLHATNCRSRREREVKTLKVETACPVVLKPVLLSYFQHPQMITYHIGLSDRSMRQANHHRGMQDNPKLS